MHLEQHLVEAWYAPRLRLRLLPLVPLALVFAALVAVRRAAYRAGLLRCARLEVPVCVVGNVCVGGTGKTPLVLALAEALVARGWHPGLITRAYGSRLSAPRMVVPQSTAEDVGDEALLLRDSGCPVWAGRDRVATARALLDARPECDLIISDDGLQHYALARDAELVVVDAQRGFGNGWPLPAGPLREPRNRLIEATAVVVHAHAAAAAPAHAKWIMRLEGARFEQLRAPEVTAEAAHFHNLRVVAVAGIGNPQRFFSSLAALGIVAETHAFPDHHFYQPADLVFPQAEAILLTAKDAVKCRQFADHRFWVLPVRAIVPDALVNLLEEKLRGSKAA
ncbi:MAG: tetraacyldisaccharide 4'-kinase [Betaproteobacteria bacterium]|nr:tetraacyldisaccharide 4'-kinase [Betaproteobacteria bacterium]